MSDGLPAGSGGRFRSFHDLMQWRVDNILLVSSLYDSFTLAEGGHINEVLLGEFLGLKLYNIPDLRRVDTGRDALEAIGEDAGYDIVIASPHVGDMDAGTLARRIHEVDRDLSVVLLAYDNRGLLEFLRTHDVSEIDLPFLWQGDIHVLFAIVKYLEDRRNVAHDVEFMGVQAIIVIEDNIRYYSSFLPQIYEEVMHHTRSLVPEGLNISHKLQRINARPKILLCRTWEEAWDYFSTYEENVLGVISDIEFPKHGRPCKDAGLRFAEQVREHQPDVPVVLHSGRPENEEPAHAVGAHFLLKGSPTLLGDLRKFMLENFGFGDFVFRMPDGTEVARASDLKSLEEVVREVPGESLLRHARRNHFSMWLKAHAEFGIAHRLRPRKVSEFSGAEEVRAYLLDAIRRHREQRTRAVVADFDPETFAPDRGFARIGGGSLGGKARGLAFANLLLTDFEIEDEFEGVRVAVPPSVVLGTDAFDEFLAANELRDFAITTDDDDEILQRFQQARFPEELRQTLRRYLELTDYPLAVRSSSLLEDSKFQPFAGIYETLMLPNNHPDLDVRLDHLVRAVKRVYASTFTQRAKNHVVSTSYRLEEEKMGVIFQKLVGARHDGRFYPEMAGVATSRNFFPVGPMKPEDGLVAVALGLGPMVVEGEDCLRFSPRHPEHIVQFSTVGDTLENSQREFYALALNDEGSRPGGTPEAELNRFDLRAAEADGTLRWVGSTYSQENYAIYDGISRRGVRLVTFAPVLKHDLFPLADVVNRLLEVSAHGAGAPVEIEFAVNLSVPAGRPQEFGFLQLRPMGSPVEVEELELGDIADDELICRSDSVLGNSREEEVHDIIVVNYRGFDRSRTPEAAREVAHLNAELLQARLPYVLIGVGRWGSRDPFLGIPVTWGQISGARSIVESGFEDLRVTPSQGTHFFQNLMSHDVGYFTANPGVGQGMVAWDWLAEQPAVRALTFVRHLHFDEPVLVKVDGPHNRGAILKPGPHRE